MASVILNPVKTILLATCLCLYPKVADSQDGAARQQSQRPGNTKDQRDRQRLIDAFEQFQNASRELGQAIALNKELKPTAIKIDDSTKVFLDLLKSQSKSRATFDPTELKNHTVQELALEALTTADRVTPYLAGVIEHEKSEAPDAAFLATVPSLEAELLRLQWIARRLK